LAERLLALKDQLLNPWYESVRNPEAAQERLLKRLVGLYSRTWYGRRHGAEKVETIEDFRRSFPIVAYHDLKPIIQEVLKGDYQALLPEPPVEWGVTSGTRGPAKLIPITPTEFRQRAVLGARMMANYLARTGNRQIFDGACLNLSFPSRLGTMRMGNRQVPYGYISGIYAKRSAESFQVDIVPSAEEVNRLGAGVSREAWQRRFNYTWKRLKGKNVTMAIGPATTLYDFGRFVRRRCGAYPWEIWDVQALFCTSVPHIQTSYKGPLKRLYGQQVDIVELYGATEGFYALQMDEKPFITPFFDAYFFEVVVNREAKMLHELEEGEWGRLVVSSCLFPRYDIGDLIQCHGGTYYRVFGRSRPWTILAHVLTQSLRSLILTFVQLF